MTKLFDYEIVYNYLQDLVENTLNENDKIPSENQLCETFNTTRATVRQGISKLKNEGIIYSKKGSGYFVNTPKISYHLSPHTSFSQEILIAHKTPSLKILQVESIRADALMANTLHVKENTELLKLKILRYVDGIPFLLAYNYINRTFFPNLEKHLSTVSSFTQLFREQYNIDPIRDFSELEITPPNEETTAYLPSTLPLIKVSSRSYSKTRETFIEYVESYFRSDMTKLYIKFNAMETSSHD